PEPALAPANRQGVEQRLGRMLVAAVTGIDDGAIQFLGEQLNRARFGMADDQHVGVHRVQRHRRVDQGLALVHRARRDRHVDHIAAEPLAGNLERGARPRRVLEEAVDDRAPEQQRALFLGLPIELDIAVGQIEDMLYVLRRQAFDTEQMTVPEYRLASSSLHEPRTIWTTRPAFKGGREGSSAEHQARECNTGSWAGWLLKGRSSSGVRLSPGGVKSFLAAPRISSGGRGIPRRSLLSGTGRVAPVRARALMQSSAVTPATAAS